MKIKSIVLGGACAAMLLAGTAWAANPGDLDTSFGPDTKIPGTVVIGVSEIVGSSTSGITVQNDGRILLIGTTFSDGGAIDFVLARLDPDGAIDRTFGNNGFVVTNLSGNQDDPNALAVQDDGKILVVGQSWEQSSSKAAVVRYNPDGTLDQSFGNNGVTMIQTSGGGEANAVAVQADGKILVAGSVHIWNEGSHMLLARLESDGTLDLDFGTQGLATCNFGRSAHGKGLVLQPNARIVVAGRAWATGIGWVFAAARFKSDGTLDGQFGTNGQATHGLGDPLSECHAIAMQSDGKLVLAGEASAEHRKHFALLRFTANGHIDPTFGDNGVVLTAIENNGSACYALDVLADDSILAAGGTGSAGFERYFTLIKYTPDGQLDPQFGDNGIAATFMWSGALAMAVDGDRAYLAGQGGYTLGLRNLAVTCHTLTGYRHGGPAPGANLRARANKTRHALATSVTWDIGALYPDTDPYSIIVLMDEPFQGIATDNNDGTLTYYPQRHHYGYDAFTYTDLHDRVGVVSIYVIPKTINDYDGDGLADPAIYCPVSGMWRVLFSGRGYSLVEAHFGGDGRQTVAADYDGDGLADPAVYHQDTGIWEVMLSASDYMTVTEQFGGPGWQPLPADYDGDGMADPAIYHQDTGTWQVMLSGNDYALTTFISAWAGWQAVPADYDGDGKIDPAAYNAADGVWQVLLSGSNYELQELAIGGPGWQPLAADYDGDGLVDFTVYNQLTGQWELKLSGGGYATIRMDFGGPDYMPVR